VRMINITKVVTKNFLVDFVSRFQNLVGLNLTYYEKMVDKGIKEIEDDLREQKINLKWYRYQISQLTNGALVIVLYGEKV